MKSENETFELEAPRDRNGSFEPELVKKNQTHMSGELESKMLSLFALGNSSVESGINVSEFKLPLHTTTTAT